jgi:hypothetical protein
MQPRIILQQLLPSPGMADALSRLRPTNAAFTAWWWWWWWWWWWSQQDTSAVATSVTAHAAFKLDSATLRSDC